MIQKFFVAFIPVFVAMDPIGLVAIFMGLASSASPEQRKRQAALGIFTAFCVAIGFVFLGQVIFDALGITDADFQVAGGLILLALAGRELLHADGASISVDSTTPNRVMLAATDEVAQTLEQLQDVLCQGPSWDAYLSAQPQFTDLRNIAAARWPEFEYAAREAVGERIVIGLPMHPDHEVIGVLSVHLSVSYSADDWEIAQFVANTVGAALLTDPDAIKEQGGSWSGRAEIHQATGMVIAQLSIPAADALAVLRAHAYADGVSLDAIAAQVVGRTLEFRRDTP